MNRDATRCAPPLPRRASRTKAVCVGATRTSTPAGVPSSAISAGSSGGWLSAGSIGMSPLLLNGVPVSHDGSRASTPLLGNGKPRMVGGRGAGAGQEQGRARGGGGGVAVVDGAGQLETSCLRFVWRCGEELGLWA